MDYSTTSSHPLHLALPNCSANPGTIGMLNLTFKHVGDGFNASMRVIGKTCPKFRFIIGPKVVKQQKGIALVTVIIAEYPLNRYPCALNCPIGFI